MPTTLSKPTASELASRKWTADDFEQACEAGDFGWEARLELIHGKVIDRMPESVLHVFLSTLLMQLMQAAFVAPRFLVRVEKHIRIAFDGDPVPDISVVYGTVYDYRNRHATPQDVALLIEVAMTSAASDTGEKALLYAQAGIEDYWVVLPETGELVVHREPSAEGYQSVTTLTGDANISPLAASDAVFTVNALFGEAG